MMDNYYDNAFFYMITSPLLFIIQAGSYKLVYYSKVDENTWLKNTTFIIVFIFACVANYKLPFLCKCGNFSVRQFIRQMFCHSLLISSMCASHDPNSHEKKIFIRIIILAACHYTFSLVLHSSKNAYMALKCCLKEKHYLKLIILSWYGYAYAVSTALAIPTTFIACNECYNDEALRVFQIVSTIVSILIGIAVVCRIEVPDRSDYTCGHVMVITTSVVVFAVCIITNIFIINFNRSKLDNVYYTTIGSFMAIFVANVILLLGMLIIYELYCAEPVPAALPAAVNESDMIFYVNEVLPQYENLNPPQYENLDLPPYREPLEPPPYVEC
jgi:hypothetical protein